MYQEVAAQLHTHRRSVVDFVVALAHTYVSTTRGSVRTWPDWDIPSEPLDDTFYEPHIISQREQKKKFTYVYQETTF